MKKNIFYLLILSCTNLISQDDSSYYKQYYNKAIEVGITKYRINDLYTNKIDVWNLEKYSELLKSNISRSLKIYSNNFESLLLISKNVVHGEVIGIEYNTDKNAGFHSIYTILVKENLVGKVADTIQILETSGFIGDVYFKSSQSYNYFIGTEYVFFIKNTEESVKETSSFVSDKSKIPDFSDKATFKNSFVTLNSIKCKNSGIYLGNKISINITDLKTLFTQLENLKLKK